MKDCVICNAELPLPMINSKGQFMKGSSYSKYCSDECLDNKFSCNLCNKSFRDRRHYERHISKCQLKVCVCKNTFYTTHHIKKFCSKKCKVNTDKIANIACPHCEYKGKDKYSVERHFKSQHKKLSCTHCKKTYTKHEGGGIHYCSEPCRLEYKLKVWSKEYVKTPERKEAARINTRKSVAKKKAEDPEWGLKPLIQRPCKYCDTVFPTRGNKKWYCNKRCIELWRMQQLRKLSVEKTVVKKCVICEESFPTNNPKMHKYCGKLCQRTNEIYNPDSKGNSVETKRRRLDWQKQWRKDPNSLHNKPLQTISSRMRSSLRQSIKHKNINNNNNKLLRLLPFSKEEIIHHLESLFAKPKWNGYEWVENSKEYSWDNMSEWHIDHIRPVASFNYTTTECEDFKKCWALNNLQPLWASDNMSKHNKWDGVVNA